MNRANEKHALIISESEGFINELILFIKEASEQEKLLINNITFEQISRYSRETSPTIIFVDLDFFEEEIFDVAQTVSQNFPDSKIIGVGNMLSVETVLKLLKLRIQDFIKVPFDEQEIKNIFKTLHSAEPKNSPVVPKQKQGLAITTLSPKGGTGVSFLTVNLAVMLAKIDPNKRIAIADLRPQSGDVTTYLNLKPEYTIRDMIDNIDHLDHAFIEGATLKHESGVHVFASPRDDQEPLSNNYLTELRDVLALLKESYDILLIDGCYIDESILEATLLHSDRILLLGNLDVPSLKGLVSALNKFEKYQFSLDQVGIIINRFNSKNRLDQAEFERKTGHTIAGSLPNDYALCIESINQGQPAVTLHSGASISDRIKKLAEMILKSEFAPEQGDPEKNPFDYSKPKSTSGRVKKALFGWLH